MTKRTYEINGLSIEIGSDLTNIVSDKRKTWRATPSRVRRRQRRYEERLTKYLLKASI